MMTEKRLPNLNSTDTLPIPAGMSRKREHLLAPRRPSYADPKHGQLQLSALSRALGRKDIEYLESQGNDARHLVRYARGCRKRFVELYLEERRKAFFATAKVAREFAADADEPELAFAVFRQTVRFRAISAALRLSLTFNLAKPAFRLLDSLAQAGGAELPSQVAQTTGATKA